MKNKTAFLLKRRTYMYKLSPSKAHRYLRCTKSLAFDKEFTESPFTVRGSLLHEYAEMLINNEDNVETFRKTHEISEYEDFLINAYVDAVLQEKQDLGAKEVFVEQRRTVKLYDFEINMVLDTLIIGRTEASILDLKTGNNDIDPVNNEQLFFYAYSIMNEYPRVKKLRLSIFQKGRKKTTTVTKDEVLDFFMEKHEKFQEIKEDKLTYNPSEKACKYCANKDNCRARAEWIIGGKK
jgi:hypothetical protein